MGLKFKIHYSFYIFLFFSVYFCSFFMFLSYFLSLFIHELSHYFMSKTYNILSQTIVLYPFGMQLNVNGDTENKFQNFLIYFVGPFINIFISLVCVAVWWVFPVMYYYLKSFCFVNLSLGLFNLIPLQPLDGGNILMLFFPRAKKCSVLKIMKYISIILSIVFFGLFLYSIFVGVNFSLFCISFFLLSAGLGNNIGYDKLCDSVAVKKIRECKIYVVREGFKTDELRNCFDSKKFVQFYIVNSKNKIVKIISQDDISSLYN